MIVTEVRLVQLANAFLSILATLLGMTIEANPVQCEKADLPIVTTP